MVYGIVGAWLSSPRTFIGSWSVWGFPHCGMVSSHCGVLSAYCQVFPLQILYSHCGVKPSGSCMNFPPIPHCGVLSCPIASWHCRDTKTLPTDFHWSMGRLLHTIVMYGVMVVCIVGIVFYLLAYVIIIIQSGGGKSNKKNEF